MSDNTTPFNNDNYPTLYKGWSEYGSSDAASGVQKSTLTNFSIDYRIPTYVDLFFDGTNYWGVVSLDGWSRYVPSSNND